MSLFINTFSLLTIEARKLSADNTKVGEMSVKYNPASLQLGYQAEYAQYEAINKQSLNNQFIGQKPTNLSLELLFGDTFYSGELDVADQIADLENLCAGIDPKTSEPLYLRLFWGEMRWGGQKYFNGRMSGFSVNYSKFDRDGAPLRATVSLQLIAETAIKFEKKTLKLPQNAVVSVASLGTLPTAVLAGVMAGAAASLSELDMAITNDLDSLNAPQPGDSLLADKEGM